MRRVVITFGLLAGFVIACLSWIIGWLCMIDKVSLDGTAWIGYASMLIALSMVFFGIKSYRDNSAGGKITFWKGVQVGLLISLIAGLMYWAGAQAFSIANPTFQSKFIQKYTDHTVENMRAQGAPQEEIDKATANIAQMGKLFENPLLFFLDCLVEFLPVGFIVTLISAALLRKKEVLPVTPEFQT